MCRSFKASTRLLMAASNDVYACSSRCQSNSRHIAFMGVVAKRSCGAGVSVVLWNRSSTNDSVLYSVPFIMLYPPAMLFFLRRSIAETKLRHMGQMSHLMVRSPVLCILIVKDAEIRNISSL